MSDLQNQINYHAARAVEELEQAERTCIDVERRAHMELSRLHLKAGQFRTSDNIRSPMTPRPTVLDMGEGSMEQGFLLLGCR